MGFVEAIEPATRENHVHLVMVSVQHDATPLDEAAIMEFEVVGEQANRVRRAMASAQLVHGDALRSLLLFDHIRVAVAAVADAACDFVVQEDKCCSLQ